MIGQASCPAQTDLEKLVLGKLSHDQAAPLEEHVSGCPRCAQTLSALRLSDTLVEALHQGRASLQDLPKGETISGLIQQVMALKRGEREGARGEGTDRSSLDR